MVTHDPRYARHADRVIHLFDGRIVEEERLPTGAVEAARIPEHELRESGFEVG
jgi:putative ABC transport system ATP-binding protein